MRMKIYTKTKLSAKEMATVYIDVNRSECFKTNGTLFVPAYAMSTIHNSKGATRKFDSSNCIVHPTKGRLFALTTQLEKYIKIVE